MTTKKALLVAGGVLATLLLVVALFIGAILGAVFYTIGHSEAAQASREFLRRSEKLKRDIGEVRDFGYFVRGSINADSSGGATLYLKVKGARRDADATVNLIYKQGHEWRVYSASFKNEAGRVVELVETDEAESAGEPDEAERDAAGGQGDREEDSQEATVDVDLAEVSDADFEEYVLRSPVPVLVNFCAVQSAPCAALRPTLLSVSDKYAGEPRVYGLNVDENPETVRRYKVKAVPTLILFKDGAEAGRIEGATTAEKINGMIDQHLDKE